MSSDGRCGSAGSRPNRNAGDPNGSFEGLNDRESDVDSLTYTVSDDREGAATCAALARIDERRAERVDAVPAQLGVMIALGPRQACRRCSAIMMR
jgi:hypothetical protein